jgi:outer membrane murein-binding lipoprotein Lpp
MISTYLLTHKTTDKNMKKLMMIAAMFAALTLTSCGSKDNPEGAQKIAELEQSLNEFQELKDKMVKGDLSAAVKAEAVLTKIGTIAGEVSQMEDQLSTAQKVKVTEIISKVDKMAEEMNQDAEKLNQE